MVLAVGASISVVACRKSPLLPAERAQGFKELQETSEELARVLEANLHEDGTLTTEAVSRHQEKLSAAAGKVGGKLGDAIQATNEHNAETGKLVKELEEMTGNISSVMDWETLAAEKDFQRRREFLAGFTAKNQGILAFYREFPEKLKAKLDALPYIGLEREVYEKNAVKGFKEITRFVTSVRNDDILFASTLQSLLDALEKDHGKWRVEEGNVVFDDEELLAEFNQASVAFGEIGAWQVQTQRELVEHMKTSAEK